MGAVRFLSMNAALEPFGSSNHRCFDLFSMHRKVQRGLILKSIPYPTDF